MEKWRPFTLGLFSHLAGPAPRGEDAIAVLRLVLQAQTPEKQDAILEAWRELSFADRSMLTDEMARSGIEGQIFDRGPAFKQVFGPAFLVYYSPAFVRNLAMTAPLICLRVLAEIYRQARELWPLRPTTGSGHSVTVRQIGPPTPHATPSTASNPHISPAPMPGAQPPSPSLPFPSPPPPHSPASRNNGSRFG